MFKIQFRGQKVFFTLCLKKIFLFSRRGVDPPPDRRHVPQKVEYLMLVAPSLWRQQYTIKKYMYIWPKVLEKDNDFDVNWTKCRVTENSMLSFNEILKVCYCRFHTAIKKNSLSDDVNYFLEEGISS